VKGRVLEKFVEEIGREGCKKGWGSGGGGFGGSRLG